MAGEHAAHVHDHDSRTLLAYVFCIAAAAVFTLLKNKQIRIPLEALIGIAYAVATTSAVIILDKGAGSDVHIHDMLTGNILWVSWHQNFRLLLMVGIIGGFHIIFRRKFRSITMTYSGKTTEIKNPGLWDFLFYLSFGIVIVEAVSIGGIITIFAFLIIPASISAIFATQWTTRIIIGLSVGCLGAVMGLYLSWIMDIPCSPAIIMFLGVFLLLSVLIGYVNKIMRKRTVR